MARKKKLNIFENQPPGGLEEEGFGFRPKNPAPPETPMNPNVAVQASQRKDRLKRSLAKKRTQMELQQTSGQQGSANRRSQRAEEEEARRFRRRRRA